MDTFNFLNRFNLLDRKKSDPSRFIFTGKSPEQKMEMQLFEYNNNFCNEDSDLALNDLKRIEATDFCSWLNIHGINQAQNIESICQKQNIHSLIIQDILDVNQRPKFQDYENLAFLTLKSILHANNDVISEQISFVFTNHMLISFQERKADYFEHLRYRLREKKGIIRERGADYLLYAMLESILDNYFKTLNKLDADIENLGFANEKKVPAPNVLQMIESHKKLVHYIKKSILPIKEFSFALERKECRFIEDRNIKYFLEIKDLCLTLIDNCDMILASLESNINLFFYIQGHRQNQVMKTLTIVATIFIPLTFIAGVYGMNFTHMPELDWRYGYLGIWIIFVLLILAMLSYFKKMKWF